jgi:hypothetical protein
MMNAWIPVIRNLFSKNHPKMALGRWAIDNCDKKTGLKVDLSNEDHCGPCGLQNDVRFRLKPRPTITKDEKEKEKEKI